MTHGPRQTRGIALPYLGAWRLAAFLTQRGLSQRAGVSQSSIAQLETGVHTARVATVGRLAAALGISREDLAHRDPAKEIADADATSARPRRRRVVIPPAAPTAGTA